MNMLIHITSRTTLLQCCCLLALWLQHINAYALPESQAVPGGIVVIPLGHHQDKPEARFNNRRIMVIQDNNQWYAVIGLPLNIKAGQHQLTMKHNGNQNQQIAFRVTHKQYPEQHITIKNKRMVNPNKLDMNKISQDRISIRQALEHWQDTQEIGLDFIKPAQGIYSSAFGLKRFFNKQARKPHSGLDIAAGKGSQILAPSAGTVTETGNFFFNGNTVFIDHGQGLVSMYCHLDNTRVKKGQRVAQGVIIGTVGMTGRVTGPHLHWSVSLNNTMVDPSLFLKPEDRPPNH